MSNVVFWINMLLFLFSNTVTPVLFIDSYVNGQHEYLNIYISVKLTYVKI